jgi:hypothetical protein
MEVLLLACPTSAPPAIAAGWLEREKERDVRQDNNQRRVKDRQGGHTCGKEMRVTSGGTWVVAVVLNLKLGWLGLGTLGMVSLGLLPLLHGEP